MSAPRYPLNPVNAPLPTSSQRPTKATGRENDVENAYPQRGAPSSQDLGPGFGFAAGLDHQWTKELTEGCVKYSSPASHLSSRTVVRVMNCEW